jgi:hypothetical protein
MLYKQNTQNWQAKKKKPIKYVLANIINIPWLFLFPHASPFMFNRPHFALLYYEWGLSIFPFIQSLPKFQVYFW